MRDTEREMMPVTRRRAPTEQRERQPGDRTPVGFALAVFLGVMAGMFLEPTLGMWSVLVGTAVAVAADRAIRWRDRRRTGRDASDGRDEQ